MANASIPITPGSGILIDTHQIASLDHQQIVRTAKSDVLDTGSYTTWTAVTTASQNQIPASESRVGVTIHNASTVRVYFRYDGTAPVTSGSNAHWYLDSGDRYEVPDWACQLPISIIAATAGSGTVNFALGLET
jgi:hypothetical protein